MFMRNDSHTIDLISPAGAISSFDRYVTSIRRFAPLDAATELRLALRWVWRRDREAARAIVESHLLFVVEIARGFIGQGIPIMELVAEGNFGLVEALERFDPLRG